MTSSQEPHDFLFEHEVEEAGGPAQPDDTDAEAGQRQTPPSGDRSSYLGWIGARSRSVFGMGPAPAAAAGIEPGADEQRSEIEGVSQVVQEARHWESGTASQGAHGSHAPAGGLHSPAARYSPQGSGDYGEDEEDLHLVGDDYTHPAHASSGLGAGGDAGSQGPGHSHWPQSYR